MRPAHGLAAAALAAAVGAAPATLSAQSSVVATVHNLSVSGPGEIRALDETEVCKFCHVPHNAEVPTPLWGHALSTARYETAEVRRGGGLREPAPQPDGASRLCLSCHDGTVALGDVAGEAQPIAMRGPVSLSAAHRGFLGTDLSGSHPVSFVMPEADLGGGGEIDMGLRPLSVVAADPDVHLDAEGKVQCTSCHDPHADRYYQPGRVPRFWVKPTVDEACLTCHALR